MICVLQCSRKLPTLYRTFSQTEYESLSDRQNFCLTEKQSARFWKNHQGRRVCMCVCVWGGGGVKKGINFKMSNTLFRVSFAVLCSCIGTRLTSKRPPWGMPAFNNCKNNFFCRLQLCLLSRPVFTKLLRTVGHYRQKFPQSDK